MGKKYINPEIRSGILGLRAFQLRQCQEQLEVTKWELEAALSDRQVELADMEAVSNYVADLRNLLDESSLVERKSFIRIFVREAQGRDAEVLLNYTIPLSVKGVTEETVAVPPLIHYGGR